MKKFTNVWLWMIAMLLSSSVLFAQAQISVSADKVPAKKELSKDQLKMLEEAGVPIQNLKSETLTNEDLILAEKLLKESKSANETYPKIKKSSTYAGKILNPDESVTVTLGTGTGTNTTTGNPTPYGTYYKNFRQQYLILAPELWLLGVGAGDITALGFEVAALNTCVDMPGFTISMKQTSVTALTTTFDNDGYTTVFYLETFLPIVGWNTHTFDTPFTWDGSSNLIIDICTTLIPGAYTQNASVYFTPTTGNTCARYQSDTQPACLTTSAGTVSVNRANMQITGEEMLNPPPGYPYNETPISGSFDIPIDGNLTWTFGDNTLTYDLWFGPLGFMTKVVDNQPSGTTGTYTYNGLDYASGYEWQVVARNESKAETFGPVWNFLTVCGDIYAPYTQNFSIWPPACWDMTGGTYEWVQYASGDLLCAKANFWGQTSGNTDVMTTPTIDVSLLESPILMFDWSHAYNSTYPDDSIQVLVSDDGGANWTVVWSRAGIEFESNDGAGNTTPGTFVTTDLIDISAFGDQIKVRFYGYSDYGPDCYIDNVMINEAPACPQPIDLGATAIASNSADLIWTSFSGLSEIEFGLAGFPPTGVPTYSGVTSPYNVAGLTSITSYSFYVRDDCGGGEFSWWSGPYTFMTQPSCAQPYDLGAENLTMTSADLTWSSFSGLSDVEFGPSGFVPTGVPTYSGITSPYNVSGLNTDAAYDFYVRDDCGGGDYSYWSGPLTFNTIPGIQILPVFEDFENGFEKFNNAVGNGTDWTINNAYYHSGVQCAHNQHGNSQTNILKETGVIDLSGAQGVWLDFWHIAKTEGDFDHCYVEISTDGGANYEPLPVESYIGAGIYEPALYNSPAGPCFDEDSYAIWGTGSETPDNATWWQHETFDLSNYLTTNVRIRFRLHSDGSVLKFGWLIDEVLIFEPAYGVLTGTVTNLATSSPIEGATVQVGSLTATSGVDGTYNFPAVLTGTWNATCSKTGFNPLTAPVTIVEDQTTTQNFALTAPQIVLSSNTVSVTLEPNATADEMVNISNLGNGSLDWDASVVIMGENGKDPWDLQLTFDVTAASGAAGNAGAECDGEFYYTTRWATNLIHKYDLEGNFVEEFSIPGVTGLRDLAYDGTYFYGGAAANTIYQMDFTNLTLVSSISSPQGVRSIAYDEENDAFWVANWDTDIALVSKTGVTLNTFPASVHQLAGIYGTAYDNWSAGGPYLWIFDQGGGVGTPQLLYQANLNTITMTGFTHDVTADLPPDADALAGGLFTIPNIYSGTVSLGGLQQGVPDRFFVYELASYSSWLSISPSSGMLAAGANEDMTLHFDATELLPGVYEAEIHFATDPDVGSPVINVTMTVEGLIPAVNLTAGFECTDVELTWEMPTGGDPDSWNIYKDGILLGNSTVMQHNDPMVMPGVAYTYHVTAVYAGEESMPSSPATITVPVPGSLQPIGLSAEANSPSYGYVTLEWNEPNACLEPDGYDVYRDNVKVNTELVTGLTYSEGPLPSGLYQYKLKAIYYFGESGFSTAAYALIPVGIEETENDHLRIFPNPASQLVNVESQVEITGIKVYNNSGQIILDEQVKVFNHQIDVSGYDKGIYYLSLETVDGNILKKITIN